jgi:2-methylcitrate dehydratase PrpD
VQALRRRVQVTVVEGFRKDQAHATLVATDGRRFEAAVAHASGTVDNPMSDAALERKFIGNATEVLGEARAREVAARIWRLDAMEDARDLLALCA